MLLPTPYLVSVFPVKDSGNVLMRKPRCTNLLNPGKQTENHSLALHPLKDWLVHTHTRTHTHTNTHTVVPTDLHMIHLAIPTPVNHGPPEWQHHTFHPCSSITHRSGLNAGLRYGLWWITILAFTKTQNTVHFYCRVTSLCCLQPGRQPELIQPDALLHYFVCLTRLVLTVSFGENSCICHCLQFISVTLNALLWQHHTFLLMCFSFWLLFIFPLFGLSVLDVGESCWMNTIGLHEL